MKNTLYFACFVLGLPMAARAAADQREVLSPMAVEGLRCEYRVDPLGIDAPRPRLSWTLQSSRRAEKQTAYQVLVASSPEDLAKDQGDLWDSGKVESDQSIHVPYSGKPLASNVACYWKVRAWDKDGRPSAWSPSAMWTMGLLGAKDWQARWIAAPAPAELTMDGCSWVWFPETDARHMAPPGTRFFRKPFRLPAGASIEQATVLVTADNSFRLLVNGKQAGGGDDYGRLHKFDVASLLVPGDNVLAITATNGGQSRNEAGVIGKLTVQLSGGKTVSVPVDATWKVAEKEQPGWLEAKFDDSQWLAARELGKFGIAPWGRPSGGSEAMPLLRRTVEIAKPVRRATVHVCGLGHYELSLNGRKVGDHVIDPGWTNYRKTCLYATYDVTAMLAQGNNALGAMLGNGMYNVVGGRYVKFQGSFGRPKLLLQMHVEYADGTSAVIASDGSWKTAPGPIVFSCVYGGEDYDARKEIPGWDSAGFDDSAWQRAAVVEGPGGTLVSQSAPPVKAMRQYKTVKRTEPRPGVFVYDLGQNFANLPQLTVKGPAGSSVRMVPGELLDAAGLVTQRSSGGPSYFTYTLKGEGSETWSPRFTYYGSRYLQVETTPDSAAKQHPEVLDLTGQFVHLSAETAGHFSCSNPTVNRIHDLINAAILSNLQSVLTDCPHREKLGWLECSHLLFGCIAYNYDVPAFYAKIVRDMREAQLENGLVPDIAPEYTVFSGGFRDSPEWGSAYVIVPTRVREMYGDCRLIEENYEDMKRYAAYLAGTAKNHIVSHGLGDWYDIGPGGPGESKLTSRGLTATAVYYGNLLALRDAAVLLGKRAEAGGFQKQAEQVAAAFSRAFFHPEKNQYDRNSQTASAMPLVLGLVERDRRGAVLENLVQDVRGRGNRVTAGDVGFHYVVHALSDAGRGDVMYDMVTQDAGPGYVYQLTHGATSLTEAWDTNPGSSQNHCMLGHAEEWFYIGLAGIQRAEAGFKKIVIRPQVVGDLAWVKADYRSMYGKIASEWKREGDRLTLNIAIPANTTATVFVPAEDASKVTEGGRPASQAEGVKFLRVEGGAAVYEVGSGRYEFSSAR